MKRNILLIIGLLVATVISTTVIASEKDDPTDKKKLKATEKLIKEMSEIPEYSMFVKALNTTNLKVKLSQLDDYTLLVPTNRAFQTLPKDVYENFLESENQEQLEKVLSYHIIPKKMDMNDLQNYKTLNTAEGSELTVVHVNDAVIIENSTLLEEKLEKDNLITYSVDRLIMPL